MAKQSKHTKAPEWWKHLRSFNKRRFWKQERRNVAHDLKEESCSDEGTYPKGKSSLGG